VCRIAAACDWTAEFTQSCRRTAVQCQENVSPRTMDAMHLRKNGWQGARNLKGKKGATMTNSDILKKEVEEHDSYVR